MVQFLRRIKDKKEKSKLMITPLEEHARRQNAKDFPGVKQQEEAKAKAEAA